MSDVAIILDFDSHGFVEARRGFDSEDFESLNTLSSLHENHACNVPHDRIVSNSALGTALCGCGDFKIHSGNDLIILIMLCLNFIFFIIELVFGLYLNSLTILADSWHMAGDAMALFSG